jgi:hypothetical protein
VSLTLAAASVSSGGSDVDNGPAHTRANTGAEVAGGVNGFKLLGMVLGLVVHSRALGCTMGAYGAGMSVYPGFFARGREVVFLKNTVMEIGVGRRQEGTAGTASRTSAAAAVARN